MAPHLPQRCSYLIDGVEPCDDWAEDGDRCDSHPRRTRPRQEPDRFDPEVD